MTKKTNKKRTRPYHHGDLRQELISHALDFLDRGGHPGDLSLRKLAGLAGVSHSAPNAHFIHKDALLAALKTAGFDQLLTELQTVPRGSDPAKNLAGLARRYLDFARKRGSLFDLMFLAPMEASGGPAPEYVEKGKQVFALACDRLTPVQSKAAKEYQTEARALQAWSFIHGLAFLGRGGMMDHLFPGTPMEEIELSQIALYVNSRVP